MSQDKKPESYRALAALPESRLSFSEHLCFENAQIQHSKQTDHMAESDFGVTARIGAALFGKHLERTIRRSI
jgi:hypothetical protein